MISSPRRRSWRLLLETSVALAVLIAMAELICRQWLVSPSASFVHPDFGLCTLPNSSVVHSTEGYSRSTTNSWGMFDDEPLAAKPPLRALLLGDSYVEAKQVPRSLNFQSVAERSLEGLEVINAGSSSRSMLNYLAVAKAAAPVFEPDVIVVVLNDGDVDALPSLKPRRIEDVRARDYTGVLRRSLDRGSYSESPLRRLARRSALVTFAYRRLKLLGSMEKTRLASKWLPSGAHAADQVRSDEAAAAFRSICEGFEEIGIPVIYMYIPHIDYHEPDLAVEYPERRRFLATVASSCGDGWLDLASPFQEYVRTHPGTALHGFSNSILGNGHLNPKGHQVVGREMAKAIADLRERLGSR